MTRSISTATTRAALAVALAAFVAPAPVASAAPVRPARPGFAIAAVGFQSSYQFRLRPGEKVRGRLRLISRSRRAQHVVLRAVDVTTAANGGLEYGSKPPRLEGRWIAIRRRVTVPAGRAVEIPFRVHPEAGTRPGDHFGGIVAINARDLRAAARRPSKQGFSLRYLPRLAIAVGVTTPGRATYQLGVETLGIDVSPSSTDVTVLLRNAGNKLLKQTTGELVVSERGRELLRQSVDIGAFVPGTTIRYRLPLQGTPAKARYQVRGRLLPSGAPAVSVGGTVSSATRPPGSCAASPAARPRAPDRRRCSSPRSPARCCSARSS